MASYAEIIAAIDDAILNWIDGPIRMSHNGKSVEYRELSDLIKARKYYVKLQQASSGGRGFKISKFAGGKAV